MLDGIESFLKKTKRKKQKNAVSTTEITKNTQKTWTQILMKDADNFHGVFFDDGELDYFVNWKEYAMIMIKRQPYFK